MRIILLGAPGAGKGTLASEICRKYPVAHISTGDILRANVKGGTPLGLEAKKFVESGKLVPDSLVVSMMEARLREPDCDKGFVLDGFPRTIGQAEALEEMLSRHCLQIDRVVFLDTPDEVVISRLAGRRVCRLCGAIYNIPFRPSARGNICEKCPGELYQREDDKEEVVRRRLKIYHEETSPLISFYRKREILSRISSERHGHSLLEELEEAVGVLK